MIDVVKSAITSGNRVALKRCEKVLFLGSDVGLQEDEGAILGRLQNAKDCHMELVTCRPSRSEDLRDELRASGPVIVHFGCYSCKTSERASNAEYDGLVLHSRTGPFVVSFDEVAKSFADSLAKLVVVTASASKPLAEKLLAYVDCAVSVDGVFSDEASTVFSRGLYKAIGNGVSIASAFQAGRLAIQWAALPGADRLRLNVRDGADARQLVVAGPRTRAPRRTPNGWALAAPSE